VNSDFADKTALVTGAGRGIGRALASGLAAAGAGLILVARSAGQLAETRDLLVAEGAVADRIRVIPADLGDEARRTSAIEAALDGGRVDILINNAATVEPLGATATVSAAALRQAFELNVVAVAALTAAVLPGMLDAGWGRVANISSGVAAHPENMVRGNAYAITKAALEAHTVNLAAELRGSGVTVNAYRPGTVDTAMQAWIREQNPERIGAAMHERFNRSFADGALITPGRSAAVLLARLRSDDTGAIWSVTTAPAGLVQGRTAACSGWGATAARAAPGTTERR
jgi:NAD(P)-dependent dehydrogenase (short-subunit alcohol dehydrogenase family)